MGEQRQFRSEQARKNYEKVERQRARAMKRKAAKATQADASAKAKDWLKSNRKQAVIAAACALAAIVLVWLGCKWFVGPGGSIPNFFGTLVGKQDHWLVIDTAEDGKTPRYHHLADFAVPEGYQLDDFSVYDDGMQQDFYCTALAEDGIVQDIYISGAKNVSAEAYPSLLLAYGFHSEAGEVTYADIAGKDAYYVCLTFDESDTDGEGMAYRSLCIYIDTDKGACITAMVNSRTLPQAELPDEAALLQEAESILSGLTLVK